MKPIPVAVPKLLDLGQGKACQVYPCPRCKAWDYALQGSIEDRDLDVGTYECTSCGTVFSIEEPVPMPYYPETDETRKEAWKAVAGLVFIVSVILLVLSGLLR